MTKKQEKDIELTKWFIPDNMKNILITDEDIKCYLENSEQGKHKDRVKSETILPVDKQNGFSTLMIGKK